MSGFGMQNSLLTIPSFAPKAFSVQQMLLISHPAIKSAHQPGILTPFGIKPGSYVIVSSAQESGSQTQRFVLLPFTQISSVSLTAQADSVSSAADTDNSASNSLTKPKKGNSPKNTEQAGSRKAQIPKAQISKTDIKKEARLDMRWAIVQILKEDRAHPERKPRTKAEITEIVGCGETLIKKMKRLLLVNPDLQKEDLREKKRGPKTKYSGKTE